MQIPLSQAHKYLPTISRSKTYADEAAGVLTATKDPSHGNKKMVSLAELERVYGKIKNPEDKQNSTESHENDNPSGHLVTEFYEQRIQDLQSQLDKAEHRETQLIEERGELLGLLKAEKEEKKEIRALMPPPGKESVEKPEQAETKPRGWLQRLMGA